WRGFRPSLRRPAVRPGDNRLLVYADAYALPVLAAVLVVLGITLAVVLLAGRSGGANNRSKSLAVASATRPPSNVSNRTGASPAAGMTIHGTALADDSGAPLSNPEVQVAVDGGGCPDYTVSSPGDAGENFALELPAGCATAGARIYFR